MSTIFVMTSQQWEDLAQRMHGEDIMRPALHRDSTGIIGMSSRQTSDLVLWLSHVAELVEDSDHWAENPIDAMHHLRYFADQVEYRDDTWWLPCVKAPSEEEEEEEGE